MEKAITSVHCTGTCVSVNLTNFFILLMELKTTACTFILYLLLYLGTIAHYRTCFLHIYVNAGDVPKTAKGNAETAGA